MDTSFVTSVVENGLTLIFVIILMVSRYLMTMTYVVVFAMVVMSVVIFANIAVSFVVVACVAVSLSVNIVRNAVVLVVNNAVRLLFVDI